METSSGGGALALAVPLLGLLAGLAVVAVGVLRLSRAARARRRRADLDARGAEVPGVVVDVQIHRRGRGPDAPSAYRPVVAFTTAQGRRVETVAGPTTTGRWVERTPVRLVHDPDDPEHARVLGPLAGVDADPSPLRTALVGAALVVVGGALAVATAAALV